MLWNFATWNLFMLCRFPLSIFTMHLQSHLMNAIGKHQTKTFLPFWGMNGILVELGGFVFSSPEDFKGFNRSRTKFFENFAFSVWLLTLLIACSWRKIIEKVTKWNKSSVSIPVNKRWTEYYLCTKRADLHYVTGRYGKNNVCFLEFNSSP